VAATRRRPAVSPFAFMADFLETLEGWVTGGTRAKQSVERTMKTLRDATPQRVHVALPPELAMRLGALAAALSIQTGRPVTVTRLVETMVTMGERAIHAKRPAQQRAKKSSV
jgi:hypothetical protein